MVSWVVTVDVNTVVVLIWDKLLIVKGNVGPGTGGYQGGTPGRGGDADRDGPTPTNPYDKGKKEFQKTREEQKAKVIDYNKAQSIYNYVPNKYTKFFPGKKVLDFFGEKLLTQKSKKNRMAYINSLPPEQRKAMMEMIGLGVDPIDNRYADKTSVDYNKLMTSLDYGPKIGSADALARINYDGEYMKQYGPPTLIQNVGGGDQKILPYPYNVQQPDEEVPEDTGPEYRFGDKQDVIYELQTTVHLVTEPRQLKVGSWALEQEELWVEL